MTGAKSNRSWYRYRGPVKAGDGSGAFGARLRAGIGLGPVADGDKQADIAAIDRQGLRSPGPMIECREPALNEKLRERARALRRQMLNEDVTGRRRRTAQ
jgi:hypothetical protein